MLKQIMKSNQSLMLREAHKTTYTYHGFKFHRKNQVCTGVAISTCSGGPFLLEYASESISLSQFNTFPKFLTGEKKCLAHNMAT